MNGSLPIPEQDDPPIIISMKILIVVLTIATLAYSVIEQTSMVLKKRRTKMGFHP